MPRHTCPDISVEAVIFDWGGTLTPWREVDLGIDIHSARHLVAMESYLEFWRLHTYAHPDAAELPAALRNLGLRVGVLSNTMWPREHHEAVFARD
jgi:putative hydrolase of the HAD superfamily